MNKAAILHRSDSRFSYALGGDKACLILQTARGDDDIAKVEILYNRWTAFYQRQLSATLPVYCHDEVHDYYRFILDMGEPDYVYVFRITDKAGKPWYYSESGFTETYNFADCFLNEFFFAYPNPVDTIQDNSAFQGRLFYQIFPERFACSDAKKSYINQAWNQEKMDNLRYCGGDFKGIIGKLDYLSSLGVGAIYLNPIHPASSAHMYDVEDYFGINPKLGTAEDFRLLVQKAHEKDIKIVMDLVFNHSSNRNTMFLDVVKNGKKSPYWSYYFIEGDKPLAKPRNYLSFCGVETMPRLNTSNPQVQEYLCQVGAYWLKEFGVDGYRLDVAFDVSHAFWRLFKARCASVNPKVILIGEDWLNSESHLSAGEWDSVMNYPFRLALMEQHQSKKGASWLASRLNGLLMRYQEASDRMMMNLFSSHDVPRWLTLLKNDKDYYFQTYALLMFYPGWPCLYYGDEILMEGGNDPDNRKAMRWDSAIFQQEEGQLMKNILALRREKVLQTGDWKLGNEGNLFYLRRFDDDCTMTLWLNLSDEEALFPLKGKLTFAYKAHQNKIFKGGFAIEKGAPSLL
jgi:cyclomaltodextrinase